MARVRYRGDNLEIEVPVGTTVLEASKKIGAKEGHACGGVSACSTCHVYVHQGLDLLSEKHDEEEDVLDKAFDVRDNSRLGCQARIVADGLVEVEITPESRKAWEDEYGGAQGEGS